MGRTLLLLILVIQMHAWIKSTTAVNETIVKVPYKVNSSWLWSWTGQWTKQDDAPGKVPYYAACDTNSQQDKWLSSDVFLVGNASRIDVTVQYAVINCSSMFLPNCKQNLKLFIYKTNILHNTDKGSNGIPDPRDKPQVYRRFGRTSPANLTSSGLLLRDNLNTEMYSFVGNSSTPYHYLAIKYEGGCFSLYSVTVSYSVCPSLALPSGLIQLPRTMAPVKGSIRVSGSCAANAQPLASNMTLYGECNASGEWSSNVTSGKCLCQAGFEEYLTGCEAKCKVNVPLIVQDGWYIKKEPGMLGFFFSEGKYLTCDTSERTEPQNWLRTDFIDFHRAKRIVISINYTIRKCNKGSPNCKEKFQLFSAQTTKSAAAPIPPNEFDFVATASPTNIKEGVPDERNMTSLNATIEAKMDGFYLAFFDQGACFALYSIKIVSSCCPERAEYLELVSFPKTVSPADDKIPLQVEGSCSDSNAKNTTALIGVCSSKGLWRINKGTRCLCKPGYGYQDNPKRCVACGVQQYKNSLNNTKCEACPNGSYPFAMKTTCKCHPGLYRVDEQVIESPCYGSPSTPRDVKPTFKNASFVTIEWTTPLDLGGRSDVYYQVECNKCNNEGRDCNMDCTGAVITHTPRTSRKATVQHISAYTYYQIKVFSKNGVSHSAEMNGEKSKYAVGLVRTEKAVCANGTYEDKSCKSCPLNSVLDMNTTNCMCVPGFYRTRDEFMHDNCTGPPSAPRDVRATFKNASFVTIEWTTPLVLGGRSDVYYQVECHKCNNEGRDCNVDCTGAAITHTQRTSRKAIVQHLSAYTFYQFKVFSKNGVSHLAEMNGEKSKYGVDFIRTRQSVPSAPVLEIKIINSTSVLLSWNLQQTNGIITTNYQVMYYPVGQETKKSVLYTTEATITITGMKEGLEYYFQVRASTSVGLGPATSKMITLNKEKKTTTSGSAEENEVHVTVPVLVTIAVFATVLD